MKRRYRVHGSRGMTLVEVLAAALLLSVIVTAVLQVYTQGWMVSANDEERLVAAHLAQLVLEEWLAAHDYQEVQKKKQAERIRTLANDAVLQAIWDDMLPQLWGEETFYDEYTPVVQLADAVPGRPGGPIRVTVTITGKNHRDVSLHGMKAEPMP